MDISNLKEGGTSVRIVPGPNGMSFHGANHKTFVGCSEGNRKATVRDVSFSSFLEATSDPHQQEHGSPLEVQGSIEIKRETANGAENRNFYSKRLPELGRITKNSEISIFEAEKYFGASEENEVGASYCKRQATKKKQTPPSPDDLYNTHHPIPSPASSIVASNRSFRAGVATGTPSACSEASWNSQAGLLSMAAGYSARNMAVNNGKRSSGKWAFGCGCPCSDKRSVDIDDRLTESRRAPSMSNSMTSNALINSSLSSIQYSYPGLGKRVLSRSIEMQRAEGFTDTASDFSDINSSTTINGGGTKTFLNSVGKIQHQGVSKEKEPIGAMRRTEEFRSNSLEKENGFSFKALPMKSEDNLRLSLEVFHSPFTRADQDSSFILDSNSKFGGDVEQDKESDSSADLFEIQSITTQATACYPMMRRRDSMDESSSIQSSYPEALGYRNSYQFGDTVTPSARSSCCEPSDVSVDWSITSADTMDKASIGNFSLEYEEIKTMKKKHTSVQNSNPSRQRRSSGGSFMGCASAKALSVALPTEQSHRPRSSHNPNRGSILFPKEKTPKDMQKAFSLPESTHSNARISGKRSTSRTDH